MNDSAGTNNDQEKIKEVKGDDDETTSVHQPRRA
jgi:hypothetical protein